MELDCQKSQNAHELAIVESAQRRDTNAHKNRHVMQLINERPCERVERAKGHGFINRIDVLR
jgi:hypothetical protein